MEYSGVSCKKRIWDILLPNGGEIKFCAEKRQASDLTCLNFPGCLYCSPIPHHAREVSREVQQQVRESGVGVGIHSGKNRVVAKYDKNP